MNAVRPTEGDRVRVTYEGEVEKVIEDGFRINGLWHYLRTTQIEVIEPALQVGWHRVVAVGETRPTGPAAPWTTSSGAVIARHWDGSQWGQSELTHSTVRSCYRSVEFLGGGCDE